MSAKMTHASTKPQPHVQELYNALQVMLLDRRIRGWLEQNDPKALQQALDAIHSTETDNPHLTDVLGRHRSTPGKSNV
jgi:hypothetical protein